MDDLKKCFKCGAEKPPSEFYAFKTRGGRLKSECKECTKAQVKKYRAENLEKVRERARLKTRKYTAEDSKKQVERTARWRSADSRRRKAHTAVWLALQSGSIVKLPCFICGSEKTEAHHPSYDLPLDVVWLCSIHHKAAHRGTP